MFFKKLIRTILIYKAQFITMTIMVVLGVGIFAGFNSEWYSIKVNSEYFYNETNFASYRMINKNGFTLDDYEKVININGVDRASRFTSFLVNDGLNSIKVSTTENKNVSGIMVLEGRNYDENDLNGIWLSKKYAELNNYHVGDNITLLYQNLTLTFIIRGFALSSEYLINLADGALMPSFDTFGYAYISPKSLLNIVKEKLDNKMLSEADLNRLALNYIDKMYYQINIISSLEYDEITSKLEKEFNKNIQLVSKDDVVSYNEVKGEESEGKTMGLILPIMFLLIAVLIMVTTMNRITKNEKVQVGILKALGFKNRRIIFHYTSYAIIVGIFGSIIGILLGYGVSYFIFNPNGAMGTYFEMPQWNIVFPWYVFVGILGIIILLTLIGFLAVKNILRGTASDALRPYEEPKMKASVLQKLSLFHKLSFGTRWNIRDTLKHPARTFMTIFGVFGSTLLVFASFGMLSTYNGFLDNYYEKSMNYKTKITLTDECENSYDLIKEYDCDYNVTTAVKLNNKNYTLEAYHITHDLYRLLDENGNAVDDIKSNGVYICRRIKDDLGYNVGDKITFIGFMDNNKYEATVVGVISSLTNGIVMTTDFLDEIGFNYMPNVLFTNKEEIKLNKDIISVQSKDEILKSFNSLTEVFYEMILLLVIFSIVLGFTVLYNLGVMSYVERYRELATLKVLGFKNNKIRGLLISQNIVLTVIGIILGIPGGHFALSLLIRMLAKDYEMTISYKWYVFIITSFLTLFVSVCVSYFVSLKVKKIDMVESLKSE